MQGCPPGRALERQLRPIADDLTGHLIPDCGHLVPLDRHELLVADQFRVITALLADPKPHAGATYSLHGPLEMDHHNASGPYFVPSP